MDPVPNDLEYNSVLMNNSEDDATEYVDEDTDDDEIAVDPVQNEGEEEDIDLETSISSIQVIKSYFF